MMALEAELVIELETQVPIFTNTIESIIWRLLFENILSWLFGSYPLLYIQIYPVLGSSTGLAAGRVCWSWWFLQWEKGDANLLSVTLFSSVSQCEYLVVICLELWFSHTSSVGREGSWGAVKLNHDPRGCLPFLMRLVVFIFSDQDKRREITSVMVSPLMSVSESVVKTAVQ